MKQSSVILICFSIFAIGVYFFNDRPISNSEEITLSVLFAVYLIAHCIEKEAERIINALNRSK